MHGDDTRAEILSQPDAWAGVLQELGARADELRGLLSSGQYDTVLFTGCGSTYYLAVAAAAVLQELAEMPARGVPASELWLFPRSAGVQRRRTLLIALSRSGRTTETVRACEAFRASGWGDLVTLSCYPGEPLTTLGTRNLLFPEGQEQSLAQTRAFSSLYLATVMLASLWAGRVDLLHELQRLPAILRGLLPAFHQRARDLAGRSELDRYYFLGSGARYGLACELSLKMKEMSLSHSEPFHFMEFRHGPKAMATTGAMIVGLVSGQARDHERAVLDETRGLGAEVLAIGEHGTDLSFDSGISEIARNLLYLPAGQLLAFERARAKGLDPDQPANLTSVITLTGV